MMEPWDHVSEMKLYTNNNSWKSMNSAELSLWQVSQCLNVAGYCGKRALRERGKRLQ